MKNWFLQKNDSEQKIIVILAIFSLLILLYSFFYLPLKRNNAQLQSSINDIQNEITLMQNLEPQIARFSTGAVKTAVVIDDGQLMMLIEDSAKQQQIPLSKIIAQSKNKISVTLENVAFNEAMRWLDSLQSQHHLTIAQLSVEAEKKGLTNITTIISH
jgi:type II secretory pathway component PulM